MHTTDNGVGLQDKVIARWWFNERGVIRQAKRAGMGRDGLEEPRDQAILGRDSGQLPKVIGDPGLLLADLEPMPQVEQ